MGNHSYKIKQNLGKKFLNALYLTLPSVVVMWGYHMCMAMLQKKFIGTCGEVKGKENTTVYLFLLLTETVLSKKRKMCQVLG